MLPTRSATMPYRFARDLKPPGRFRRTHALGFAIPVPGLIDIGGHPDHAELCQYDGVERRAQGNRRGDVAGFSRTPERRPCGDQIAHGDQLLALLYERRDLLRTEHMQRFVRDRRCRAGRFEPAAPWQPRRWMTIPSVPHWPAEPGRRARTVCELVGSCANRRALLLPDRRIEHLLDQRELRLSLGLRLRYRLLERGEIEKYRDDAGRRDQRQDQPSQTAALRRRGRGRHALRLERGRRRKASPLAARMPDRRLTMGRRHPTPALESRGDFLALQPAQTRFQPLDIVAVRDRVPTGGRPGMEIAIRVHAGLQRAPVPRLGFATGRRYVRRRRRPAPCVLWRVRRPRRILVVGNGRERIVIVPRVRRMLLGCGQFISLVRRIRERIIRIGWSPRWGTHVLTLPC